MTEIITTRASRFTVDPGGTVSVWDSVAGRFTRHHGLTARQVSRIRKLAANRLVIRYSEDGSTSMVWSADGRPIRRATQHDRETMPVGADMTDFEARFR